MPESFRVTDHVAQGLSRVIGQYRHLPRFEGLLRSYLEEIQQLSDAIYATILSRLVDHATGHHLRVIGKLVGQPWREEEEERYRRLVRARIAVNLSSGRINELIRIVSLVTNGLAHRIVPLYPMTLIVDMEESTPDADLLASMLQEAKGAGVALSLHWMEGHDADTAFSFSETDEFTDDSVRGFGGDDPETGPGGLWIGDY